MFESDKRSPLERLKKGLYSRNAKESEAPRHDIHIGRSNVSESWDAPNGTEGPADDKPIEVTPERRYAYKIAFICSALFLVAAFAIAAYTFFGGGNYISVENVDIQVEGPSSVAGGEPLSIDVSVANKNQTDIDLVDLVVEFPQGTKDPSNPAKDLSRIRVSLGDIGSQSVVQKPFSALMFGREGEVRDIKLTAEYRTADSNAIFFKEKIYHVTISSSPVLVLVDALDKVLGGEAFDVTITVSSNTTAPVKDVLLSLDYPFGFSVISSDPQATYGDNVWRIGDLAPGSKRMIKLRATATGQDGEDRTVHASVGIQSAGNEREIATTIITQDHTFTIEKPFLGLDLALDGQRGDLAADAGRTVHADVIWTNNSGTQITNARITAKLGGSALDKNSVSVDNGGFYDSLTNTITWEAGRTAGLDTIAPGDDGRVGFSVASTQSAPNQSRSAIDPVITIAVSVSGSRTDEAGTPQSINTAVSRSIKLLSNLGISSRAVYSQGPFKNSGPVPPKVDQATTYTIVWTVTNTSNTITGAKVTATLPPYVAWTGNISPTGADISYDQKGGTIVWNIGEVPRNADIGSGAKQVAFQISLKPSANQAGTVPELVGQASVSGTDVFTGAAAKNAAGSLSTRISTDLLYKAGDEIVQK
ncbi:DUF11 domain-containing protein [Candidatus Parcubacteria bacterium]|nr:DUF11 domain-containing protein [Candidatus Parcubacteria bacterium]